MCRGLLDAMYKRVYVSAKLTWCEVCIFNVALEGCLLATKYYLVLKKLISIVINWITEK